MNTHISMNTGEYRQLVIETVREETKDFKTFSFRDGHHLKYEAGQFITLVDFIGTREIRRSYSIVSSPVLEEPLSIGVKRIDNGFFSRKLFDKTLPGDLLTTIGVSGFFKLPENIKFFNSIFFFAAGSGISPILSLIKTTLYAHPKISVYLIYSNTTPENTAYIRLLKQLEKDFRGRFTIDFLFSTASDLRKARLNSDRILELLLIHTANLEKSLFYICGPESYMRLVIFLLIEEGFPNEHIKKEDFNPGNRKLSLKLPADKNNYEVQLKTNEKNYSFTIHYPDTILQAAKKLKFNLPYSCETGKCGTCVARCLHGIVWMSNNEVLTDHELSNGLILTCTGHPQSSGVVLEIGL